MTSKSEGILFKIIFYKIKDAPSFTPSFFFANQTLVISKTYLYALWI